MSLTEMKGGKGDYVADMWRELRVRNEAARERKEEKEGYYVMEFGK